MDLLYILFFIAVIIVLCIKIITGKIQMYALIMYMIEMNYKEPTKEQMIQYTSKWINLWFKKKVS